jgi:hypothetical protein
MGGGVVAEGRRQRGVRIAAIAGIADIARDRKNKNPRFGNIVQQPAEGNRSKKHRSDRGPSLRSGLRRNVFK